MKKRTIVANIGIGSILLGITIAGVGAEFFATASNDFDNCFLSPHDRGCENELPTIAEESEEGEGSDLESYFISETLHDHFSEKVDKVLEEPSQVEYLSIRFD